MLKKILFSSLVLTIALNANEIDCEDVFERCTDKCEQTQGETKDQMCIEKCEYEFDKCLISQEPTTENEPAEQYQENDQDQNQN
ncbi:hypothetical protein [Arcobacter roscoffensis]|uniref:Uncharacterized protein n=1 Tax=Arcobacter roscoffensis TaxID=2961520 RepID=A0ABY5E5T1_9BACT|nr:hypothetical protein [Arcobacter roscoffensis]UTJ07516.1 hypothetical protein NJU99_05310 [Arcobacter roscoffensis]|tara:strand:+ start:1475 stop:1726 length:252 start_codon:yes stop_codon:yes gene_type:complete